MRSVIVFYSISRYRHSLEIWKVQKFVDAQPIIWPLYEQSVDHLVHNSRILEHDLF